MLNTKIHSYKDLPLWKKENAEKIKGWNVIISKDRAQKTKRNRFHPNSIPETAAPAALAAAAAIADEWNVKYMPYQALS